MTERIRHPMTHFKTHDDQDLRDLDYGGQREHCERTATESEDDKKTWRDHSITGTWCPEED